MFMWLCGAVKNFLWGRRWKSEERKKSYVVGLSCLCWLLTAVKLLLMLATLCVNTRELDFHPAIEIPLNSKMCFAYCCFTWMFDPHCEEWCMCTVCFHIHPGTNPLHVYAYVANKTDSDSDADLLKGGGLSGLTLNLSWRRVLMSMICDITTNRPIMVQYVTYTSDVET